MRKLTPSLLMMLMLLWGSCSHKYDPDRHNLDFYQWNLWEDVEADPEDDPPSCGWDDLHRGKGKLVRIPASLEGHFPDGEPGGVYWSHCRFTLPEQWQGNAVSMEFAGSGAILKLFLNEKLIGSCQGDTASMALVVSEDIYYTRDNHLSIRIIPADGGTKGNENGITRVELLKSN